MKNGVIFSLIIILTMTASSLAGSSDTRSESLRTVQTQELLKINSMIDQVHANYPDARVTLVINGDTRILTSNLQNSVASKQSRVNMIWAQYGRPIQVSLANLTIQSMEIVRWTVDNQLVGAMNLVSRWMLGFDVASKCVRICRA